MPEVDLRNIPWLQGFPREEQLVDRELYRLITIFGASGELAQRRTSKEGACVYSWSVRTFEFPEIGRILLTIAALVRSEWDAGPSRLDDNLSLFPGDSSVGVLLPDVEDPSASVPLTLRESLNKILHAYALNLERSEGTSPFEGHLLPAIHLYGERHDKAWKATLNVFRWAEVLHSIT